MGPALKGEIRFHAVVYLRWSRPPPMPPPANTQPLPPAIIRAVQEQLGLKLEPKKVSVDFLTVELAERAPLEN
jgi:uncharacterized protein (TIGR03435 family)